MTEKYICIHGHFYQPPRENPWLEEVEFEESAQPYHDWNARITAECYAPNSVARIMDSQWRIIGKVNNYSKISFNFGPRFSTGLQVMNLSFTSQYLNLTKKVLKAIQDTVPRLLRSTIT